MSEAVPVEGDGIELRGWRPEDRDFVVAAATDPAIMVWNPIAAPVDDYLAHRTDWSDGTHASWAVVDLAEPDVVVGSVSLYRIDRDQLLCEAGYWIAAGYRGRRLATRALRLAAGYGFGQLGLRRIELFHALANPGSCRVAVAAGFRTEGTHRESHRNGDGKWHDEHSHARLATDPV
jgi:RimJ/RimL family protein N-acetyltransferase